MSESTTQNLKNHGPLDPAYHFVLLPILLLNLIYSIVHLVRHLNLHSGWFLVLSLAAFILAFKVRSYALKSTTQNLKNHGRLDPAYHFVLLPILLLNLIYSIVHLVRHLNLHSG